MRKLLFILMVLPFTLNVRAEDPPSMLEKAVSNIKRWEGWHRGKMPYIGFGHRLLPHEKLTENLSEAQADSLLRCDLERCLKVFRKYGKDSLLLSLLGFNVGCYRLIGNGKIPKSRLIQKLESGDRDIYREYISFRCYQGKVIPSIDRKKREQGRTAGSEKTAASISDRTAVAGDRAAISEKIRFGRCGDRNRDNHRKPWII